MWHCMWSVWSRIFFADMRQVHICKETHLYCKLPAQTHLLLRLLTIHMHQSASLHGRGQLHPDTPQRPEGAATTSVCCRARRTQPRSWVRGRYTSAAGQFSARALAITCAPGLARYHHPCTTAAARLSVHCSNKLAAVLSQHCSRFLEQKTYTRCSQAEYRHQQGCCTAEHLHGFRLRTDTSTEANSRSVVWAFAPAQRHLNLSSTVLPSRALSAPAAMPRLAAPPAAAATAGIPAKAAAYCAAACCLAAASASAVQC